MADSPRIHILSEELCNKIAAGEVIERPASVVKELLENAIDAAATDILIELGGGGKTLIRVADNGCGMNRQDALLSLERHATSKIRTDEDLFALSTLGFRGEALASIASVSRFGLKTCDNEDGLGHHIYAEGGKIRKVTELGLPRGSSVEVRNLFFNLPARKKFLRKDQTELGHAADVVTRQALARPDIRFRLKHNDRLMLDLRRERDLPERFSALLGRSLLKDMVALDHQPQSDLSLTGLISSPQLSRSATSHIHTFINGRYIRDRVVQHAVMDGYRQLLMKGRYPVVALFLQIDPELVDVNVHPTKHEVRFRDQGLVHDFISSAIRAALKPASWLADPSVPDAAANSHDDRSPGRWPLPDQGEVTAPDRDTGNVPFSKTTAVRESQGFYPGSRGACAPEPAAEAAEAAEEQPFPRQSAPLMTTESRQPDLPGSSAAGFFSGLTILGQYHQSYILCQQGNDLLLVDQHAAHERVGFEQLKRSYAAGAVPAQKLLFPEILDLDYTSAAALESYLPELVRLGFDIEPFGGKSFALKAAPSLLSATPLASLIVDIALELERIGRAGKVTESIDEVLIMMACHRVVRANQALSLPEIKALFAELDKIDFKGNCPHGRPVMVRMTLYEVERLFRRHG